MNLPSISVPHPLIVPIAPWARTVIPGRRGVVIRGPVTLIGPIRIGGAAANGTADRPLRGARSSITPEADRVGGTRRTDRHGGDRGRRGQGNHGVAHQ